MKGQGEESVMDMKGVGFYGKIAAAFTHEMKNVLAIIKESTGLMEDLLSMTQPESFRYHERFGRAVQSVLQQVQRGVVMSTRLNWLAHCPDSTLAPVDVPGALEKLIGLSERFARMKIIDMKLITSGEEILIGTRPVELALMLFSLMECFWECMKEKGELAFTCVSRDGGVAIEVALDPESRALIVNPTVVEGLEKWALMKNALDEIQGTYTWNGDDAAHPLTLFLPSLD